MSWHYLRHNKATEIPHNLAFVDTETWPLPAMGQRWWRSQSLRLGVATAVRLEGGKITRRSECRFTTAADFWEWLCGRLQRREPLWLFAHNAAFDFPLVGLLHKIESGEFVFPHREKRYGKDGRELPGEWFDNAFMCIDSLPVIFKGEVPGRGKLVALDSLNYFPCSLKLVGEAIGLPKLDMPSFAAPESDWWDYCENDTLILERAITELIRWWDSTDCGNFRYTAGGLALSLYRHRFLQGKLCFHDEPQAKSLERAGYFGGQLECFRLGQFKERMFCLDVNSLYPYVMRANLFPCKLAAYHTPETCTVDRPAGGEEECIADVLLDSPMRSYPVRMGAGHQYATGRFRTVLAGPELAAAVKWGDVVQFFAWTRYRLADLFSGYVDHVLELRRAARAAGDKLRETFAKLLANSLYGKLGQWDSEWIPADDVVPLQPWSRWEVHDLRNDRVRSYRAIGWHVFENRGKVERENTLPAICAFVTAYGRSYMAHLRKLAGFQNTYYQSNDSLHVNECGFENLQRAGMLDEHEPGKLKIESTDTEASYFGLHRFKCGKRIAQGAIKRGTVPRSDGRAVFETFEKLPAICRRPPDGIVRTFVREVEFTDDRYRARIGQGGWIEPLVLGPDDPPASAIDPDSVTSATDRWRAAFDKS